MANNDDSIILSESSLEIYTYIPEFTLKIITRIINNETKIASKHVILYFF